MKFNAEEIAEFIANAYPGADQWDQPSLARWVNWSILNGFLLMVGDGDMILGLAIVRPVFRPHEVSQSLEFDPEGDTYFVDLAIVLYPKLPVLQALCFAGLKRFGMRDKLAFQKKGIGPVYVVDAHAHRRKLLRNLKERTHHG